MFGWFKRSIFRSSHGTAAHGADAVAASPPQIRSGCAHHIALGDQCLKAGAAADAAKHYREAIALEPKCADAHRLLGDALRAQGNLGEAALCYRKALEFAPNLAHAHYGLGVTVLERADFHNATVHFRTALARKPDLAEAHNGLGFALLELGERSAALACFEETIRIDPHNGMAQHLAASLTGGNPERPSPQYVEKLFDGFAEDFDSQLQQLDYDTPEKLASLIAQCRAGCAGNWNVLDLGCGTGLVGLKIAPYAKQLVGVDLSTKMLEKARARNVYHRLALGDLTTMMQNEVAASYDIIVAADTFIYVGKLDVVVSEVKRLLRTGGLFAFSVEALETLPDPQPSESPGAGYRLQPAPSCRYAHSSQYLATLAADHDLCVRHMASAHLRKSEGRSVSGYLVLMENAPSTPA